MLKRLTTGFVGAVAGLLLLPSGAHADADKTWTLEDFGSDISVGADGTLTVAETIKVNFITQHHGIYRYIPTELPYNDSFHRTYRVSDLGVFDAKGGAVEYYTQNANDQASSLEYIIGSGFELVTGPQTYVIKYSVGGALDEINHRDGLAWHVMGDQWPVGVAHLHATLHMPSGAADVYGSCLEGSASSNAACKVTRSGSTITYSADRPLQAGEDMRIEGDFPTGIVPTPKPGLVRIFPGYFNHGPMNILAVAAVLIAGLALIFWRMRLGPLAPHPSVVAEFAPPENFRPAQLGLILDEIPDTKDVTATIIDLASRGYLTIQSIDGDYVLYRQAGIEGLQPYEATLFQGLFANRDSVKVSELSDNFYGTLGECEDALAFDARQRRWFKGDPRKVSSRWHGLGVLLLFIGAGLTWYLGWIAGFGLVGIAAASDGLLIIATAPLMPRRSSIGDDLLQHTLGFQLYMTTAEKYRQQFAEKEEIFTQLLPYAIVFGCCDQWAAAFAGIATKPPQWYSDGEGPFNPALLSTRLQVFHSSLGSSAGRAPSFSGGRTGYSGLVSTFAGGGGGGGFRSGGGGGGGGAW